MSDNNTDILAGVKNMFGSSVSGATAAQLAISSIGNAVNVMVATMKPLAGVVSASMNRIGASADVANQSFSSLAATAQNMGKVVKELELNLASTNKAINNIAMSASSATTHGNGRMNLLKSAGEGGKQILESIGKHGMKGLTSVGNYIMDNVIDKAIAIKDMGIAATKTHDEYKLKSGDGQGEKLYGEMTQFIKGSVFGKDTYKDGINLVNNGIDTKDVMGYVKQIGDVSMGDPEKMHNLTEAFGDTHKEGVLSDVNLNKFTDAGFDPLKEMARTSGKSYGALEKDVDGGKISFAMVADAFKSATSQGGEYNGMLAKVGATTEGKEEAMSNHFDMAKQSLAESLMPAYDKMLTALQPVLDQLPDVFGRLAPYVDKLADYFVALLPSIQSFGGTLWSLLKPFSEVLLGDSMKALAKNVVEVAGKIGEFLLPVLNSLKPLGNFLINMVSYAISVVGKVIDVGKWLMGAGNDDKKDGILQPENSFMGGNSPAALPANQASISGAPNTVVQTANLLQKPQKDITKANEASAAITGGGGKQIIINVNKPFYNVEGDQVFQSVVDAVKDFEPKVREAFLRILQSANAALG